MAGAGRHVPQRGPARDSATRLSKNLGWGVGSQNLGMNVREPNPAPKGSEPSTSTGRGCTPWRPSSEGPEAAEPLGGQGPG